MNTRALVLEPASDHGVLAHCRCFAPFGKGGYGGFALDLKQKKEQIPLNPPFSKGEARALPQTAEVSGQGAP